MKKTILILSVLSMILISGCIQTSRECPEPRVEDYQAYRDLQELHTSCERALEQCEEELIPISASYWKNADIAIPSYTLSAATDTLTITAKNNLKNSISSLKVIIGGDTLSCTETSLAPQETTSCSGIKTCASAGDTYSYDVSINYIDDETGASYSFTGEGHKLVGKCS